jgi:hypothetical protein
VFTDSRTKLSARKAKALEQFIKTIDRFGMMEPYLITIEMKPGTSLNKYSDIVYDQPQKVYGIVIRIINQEGIVRRFTIDESDE